MLEHSTHFRSLESQGRPFGTGRSPGNPFTSAPRVRREGQEVGHESKEPGGRRRASAERDAHRTERRERQWLEEQTRGTRREERAAKEEAHASERFEKQRGAKPGGNRGAARGERQQAGPTGAFQANPTGSGSTFVEAQPKPASAAQGSPELAALATDQAPAETDGATELLWTPNRPNTIERVTAPQLVTANGQAAAHAASAGSNAAGGSRAQNTVPQAVAANAPSAEPKAANESARTEAREPLPAPPEPERATEIIRQFRMQLNPGMKSALIELAPAELGRIRIEMKIDGGKLRAIVRAEKPEALAALEAHLPELRSALEQQGLVADDLDLGLGFDGDGDAQTGRFGGARQPAAELVEPEIDHDSLARAVARRSGVDFYA